MKKQILILALVLTGLNVIAQWKQTTGPKGGSVKCFAADGTNIFAGTDVGGVFLSSDNGSSWAGVNIGLLHCEILSMAFSGTTIFAGTGGNGVFMSANNGANWTAANNGLPTTSSVNELAVMGTTIYAAVGGEGVFQSTDNGNTWNAINTGLNLNVRCLAIMDSSIFVGTTTGVFLFDNNSAQWNLANTGLPANDVYALSVIDTTIFAGISGGVYKSVNKGSNWSVSNTGLTDLNLRKFAVSGTNLYAGTQGGVFLSTNKGATWTAVNNGLPGANMVINALGVMGTSVFIGFNFPNGLGGGAYVSTNGTAWTESNYGLAASISYPIAVSGTNVFAATDHGMYLTSDNGNSWLAINNGLSPASYQIHQLAVNGTAIYIGTQGGSYRSTNNGSNWASFGLGPNTYATSFARSGNHLFMGTTNKGVLDGNSLMPLDSGLTNLAVFCLAASDTAIFAGTTTGVFLSTNNGISWSHVNNGLTASVYSLVINGSSIFAGTSTGEIYVSTNNGGNWTLVNIGFTFPYAVYLVKNSTNIFAGTSNGVLLSTDNGNTWSQENTGLTNTGILSIDIRGRDIYIGTSGDGVWTRPLSEMINCVAYYTTSYNSLINSFTLNVDSLSNASAIAYQWDFGDGTTSTMAFPSHTYSKDSVYNVCMKIYTSSGDSCTYCHYIGKDSLGNIIRSGNGFILNIQNPGTITAVASDLSNETKITVYPNPLTSYTNIAFSENQKNTTVTIIDVLGKEIGIWKIENASILEIKKGEMKAGIYFLRIMDEKKTIVNKKIIIQ